MRWSRVRGAGRWVRLAALLVLTALVVPDAAARTAPLSVVSLESARAVEAPADVLWVLALGSDARPGEAVTRSRADAIQLVGLNVRTGAAVAFGVPRDSWVPIPGVGYDRVNAALFHGGPQLIGETVGEMFGLQPDYVVTTGFEGFRAMVQNIGGITVDSPLAFTDDAMVGSIDAGENRLNGFEALFFTRARHFLPRGDFDRSANQQEALRGIIGEVQAKHDRPGFMERALFSVLRHLETDLAPVELYRLAQAATAVHPDLLTACVLDGTIGDVGGASVVFADLEQARRLAEQARTDATLEGPCA